MVTHPTEEALSYLNSWPEGTLGHSQDKQLIATLIALCSEFGYGRVGQLANDIEELWRDPSLIEHHKKAHADRMKLMKGTMEYYEKERAKKKR